MDLAQQDWLDRRVPRERRHEIGRQLAALARQVVPDCIVADETAGNSIPLEIDFRVEIYNVPQEEYISVQRAVSKYRYRLLKTENLFVHIHISSDSPPPNAEIVAGRAQMAVAEDTPEYGR